MRGFLSVTRIYTFIDIYLLLCLMLILRKDINNIKQNKYKRTKYMYTCAQTTPRHDLAWLSSV